VIQSEIDDVSTVEPLTSVRVVSKLPVDMHAIISIDPNIDELLALQAELSQIQYSVNSAEKS
jgi:succinate dehydrogenase/fumarate reductase-like Fe-S protein